MGAGSRMLTRLCRSPPQEPGATPSRAPRPGAMHCEVAEAHPDKRPKEAPGAPGPARGPVGLGAHMAFRVTVSGGGCGDGSPRDLLPRPPAPPPRTHDLLRPRSPRDYGASKAAGGKECLRCEEPKRNNIHLVDWPQTLHSFMARLLPGSPCLTASCYHQAGINGQQEGEKKTSSSCSVKKRCQGTELASECGSALAAELVRTVNGSYSHCTPGSEKSLLDLDLAEGPGPTCHQGLFLPAGTPPPRGHPPACERLLHFPHPHRSPRSQPTYMNGGLPATQHIKQESLPAYQAMAEARAPLSAHCRAPPAAGLHADLDLPGRGLANPASSCYLLGSEPSSGLGPPPEAHLPEGSLKHCCLLGLPPTSSASSSSPCVSSSDVAPISRSSQTALVTCVNGLRSPPLPGNPGGPPKRALPSPPCTESHEGSLQFEACRKMGFLKQEPVDEFSELFGPPQHSLPPPYPLPQLPTGPGLGGLGLGLVGRAVAGRQTCRWVDCCAAYEQQEELVRHIEKSHIDQRKGEDFTCFWAGCVRRYKPFNARYKLLIHMRVHSGEKPNKCMLRAFTQCPSQEGSLGLLLELSLALASSSEEGSGIRACVAPRFVEFFHTPMLSVTQGPTSWGIQSGKGAVSLHGAQSDISRARVEAGSPGNWQCERHPPGPGVHFWCPTACGAVNWMSFCSLQESGLGDEKELAVWTVGSSEHLEIGLGDEKELAVWTVSSSEHLEADLG
ncbi:Zinc finger protein GLIS1 [Tupaia chinensis]|uniref:Zinc finger protein GLIS1 n=1 Tax=Tupaia chinensis TaxID=246437 RepID=L9KW82_TUPCH|nr:Zinc finger protein GLIS1 [Tupaia chinensis]